VLNAAVLLIGFGGPRSPQETKPFLDNVLQGVRIPQQRFQEVLHHYEVIGGVSPYIEYTEKQRQALEIELTKRGLALPVLAGYRHSKPFFEDIFLELKKQGIQTVFGFVLSPLRAYSSFGKYVDRVEEAKREIQAQDISVLYTPPFDTDLLFIEAQSDRIRQTMSQIPANEIEKTHFIFSAHSIPVEKPYADQFTGTTRRIVEKLNIKHWTIAYQSRSGNPKDPWLEPSVEAAMEKINPKRFKNVLITPSGFLCDNVEVLFDLDIQVKEKAESLGLAYYRAKTVMDHPKFIEMMANQIQQMKG
jgi:ferrochelatase